MRGDTLDQIEARLATAEREGVGSGEICGLAREAIAYLRRCVASADRPEGASLSVGPAPPSMASASIGRRRR